MAAEGTTVRPSPMELVQMAMDGPAPLLSGRELTCPSCERRADILDYVPLEYSERYAAYVVAPLKCRSCKHVFALRP